MARYPEEQGGPDIRDELRGGRLRDSTQGAEEPEPGEGLQGGCGFLPELGQAEVGDNSVQYIEASYEDIETILGNVKYIDCKPCDDNRKNGRRLLNEDCTLCKGWGARVNPRYAEAAERMGLPVPLTPERMGVARIDAVMRQRGIRMDQTIVDDLRKYFP
jgi:hypothetical protein